MKAPPVQLDRTPKTYRGYVLDPFQREAISAVEAGMSTLVAAPTGTGKTLVADYVIEMAHQKGVRVIYTAPIKALSNQKFKEFKRLLGASEVAILTGDVVINPDAPVAIMTTEVFRNLLHLQPERLEAVGWVIFDEIHYIDDPERGFVWEESLLFLPPSVRFLGLSATIPNARELADWIESVHGRPVHVVYHHERAVPLEHHLYEPSLGICSRSRLIRHARRLEARGGLWPRGRRLSAFGPALRYPPVDPMALLEEAGDHRLPALFFVFSRRMTEVYAEQLARSRDFLSAAEKAQVRQVVEQTVAPYPQAAARRAMDYLGLWERGVGFHHAGLLPAVKDAVEELFERRLLWVLFCTETFAVGVNFPCRTVFFGSLRKYDGVDYRPLTNREYFQMAGRAGRRGIDERGFVFAAVDLNEIRADEIPTLDEADVEPLKSQFTLSYNSVLNLTRRFTDTEIRALLRRNFSAFQSQAARRRLQEAIDSVQGQLDGAHGADLPARVRRRLRRRLFALQAELERLPGPEAYEMEFERRRRVLSELDYVRDGQLTSRGELGCRIHIQELLVTELLADGYLRRLQPEQLLAVAVGMDYEPRRTEVPPARLPPWLGPLYQTMRAVAQVERSVLGFSTVRFGPHLLHATLRWASGDPLEECLRGTGTDEGDFVFAMRRGIDLLRQLRLAAQGDPRIEQLVGEAIRAADRDEVAVVL